MTLFPLMFHPLWRLSLEHEIFMKVALSLAEKGAGWCEPNPMVGAVIVKNGKIISYGYHRKFGQPHGEAVAIKRAGEKAKGATLYVNLEPCCHFGKTPPCCEAIWKSGIKKVVASIQDPNPLVSGKGFSFLKEKGVEVIKGILEEDAEQINRHFLWFHRKKRPWLTGKMAMTADGSTVWRERWISSEQARKFAHWLRATHMGIMVGINTVLEDDPILNIRHPAFAEKKITKIILDTELKIRKNAKVFSTKDPIIIFTASNRKIKAEGVETVKISRGKGGINIEEVLKALAERKIISVLVEGGATLMSNLIKQRKLNELYLIHSPKLGGTKKLTVSGRKIISSKTWIKGNETYTDLELEAV